MRTETGKPRRRALLPWLRALQPRLVVVRPRPLPAQRSLMLSAALVALGLLLSPLAYGGPGRTPAGGVDLTWWQLAAGFALAAVFVFHVEINSEAHTFSLSEVPLVLGLLFCSPRELLVARLVGEAVVLAGWERQSAPKLVFNLSVFFAETTAAVTLLRLIRTGYAGGPLEPVTWVAALVSVTVAGLLGTAAVWAVIRLHGGEVSQVRLLGAAMVTSVVNTSLATIAVVLLTVEPLALVPLAIISAVVVAAYRGYTRLTRRYAGLELLYQFTRITSDAQRPDETLRRVLDEAGRLLRTRRAAIALYSPEQDVPWAFVRWSADGVDGADGADGGRPDVLPEALRRRLTSSGQVVLVPRTAALPWQRAVLAELGAKDCLAAPLVSGGEVTGLIVVSDRLGEVSTFDAEDGRLFATLASQAAIALENGQLIERLQTQVSAREHEALHDALTGLPNRVLLARRLTAALDERAAAHVGVFLLDLNGFKEVNDTLGHAAGDDLLKEVAARLSDLIGDTGTVSRLGGDEFAVLLPRLPDVESGQAVGWRIHEAVRRPVRLGTMTVEVGASIGLSVWPDHGDDASSLLQRADVAMYAAKQAHAGVRLYDPAMDRDSQHRLRLAGELRAALASGQIDVRYQPIARGADVRVVGAEALARWNHPELGLIPPDEFVPVAERSGLVHELTLHVLKRALAQVASWRAAGLELTVSVNLPPQVLRDVEWSDRVAELLARHGARPEWLVFEITESGIMTDPERMIDVLRELRTTGVRFSIDDFGTGYSSLAYLQQLPVSTVKIDKSFVTGMVGDPAAAAIVRSVIDLARSLGLAVVAEGVEDQRTLEHLVLGGCDYVQGFFVSRPIPADELTAWLSLHQAPR